MIYKTRNESTELKRLTILNDRINLPENVKQYYFNLKKGYEGELAFDQLIGNLDCDCLVLNDLLLKFNNTTFQMDTLLIMAEEIHIFEVKNFEGDFYYQSDRIYKDPNKEIMNPITQLNRTESLLRQLLQTLGYEIAIKASVVFINPEFTLYQSPLNKPFIFPTQINRLLKQLNSNPLKLREHHKTLATKLVSLHQHESPFKQMFSYNYEELQKGISCAQCHSMEVVVEGKNCVCRICESRETLANAVVRSVNELKTLFPNEKITTNLVFDWCKIISSKKRIQRILSRNFDVNGVHQWAYYE